MVSSREVIIRNGLPPVLVDDPLFRKTLVTTSLMGQTVVWKGKESLDDALCDLLPNFLFIINR
jgi:hypothetical protein